MKNTIVFIVLLLFVFVSVLLFSKIYCLKIKKNYGFAIGQITEIHGRDINEVEYAEFKFLLNDEIFMNKTMINQPNINAKQKFLVVYCRKNPKISVLLMNYSFVHDLALETKIDDLYHRDSISIPWEIL